MARCPGGVTIHCSLENGGAGSHSEQQAVAPEQTLECVYGNIFV